jgi:hypothetical protein
MTLGVPSEFCHRSFEAQGERLLTTRPLGDADIRRPLHAWLEKLHERSETAILHEFKMPRPTGRIDLAVVNGKMVGFEIKSDLDTLARIERQSAAYEQVFDRVCIVATARHLNAVLAKVPSWWGIVVPNVRKEKITFKPHRRMRRNPTKNDSALLYTLTKTELLEILRATKTDRGMKSKKKKDLITFALKALSSKRLRDGARRVLRARDRAQNSSSPSISPTVS